MYINFILYKHYFSGGDDYESNSLSKTYDGDTSVMCIGVTIIDDTLPEDALEFFSLRLSSTDSAVVFTNPYADVAIMNDDSEYMHIVGFKATLSTI